MGQTAPMDEEVLAGGVANAGAVVRIGDHVLRPASRFTPSIHRFLTSVATAGFGGAPAPVGVDDDGRERLVFIPGEVPIPPFPDWAQTDETLVSVATLLRRFHAASAAVGAGGAWSDEMADPDGGPIVRHNDVCLENVVFRTGVAVGLLDFDFAAPGRPVYDLAQFARMCVPVDDDVSSARSGWAASDRPARLRMVAEAYGLSPGERIELTAVLSQTIERGGGFVRRRVAAGDPNFISMWNEMGGDERFDRRRRWWDIHHGAFADALR